MTDNDADPIVVEDLPGISVVVIGRNEGARLARCLESVWAADYPADRIELIYVDTDSTDDSCAVAEMLGAKVIRIQPERPSAAGARNVGFRTARHDLIHFLDGDTILNGTWLRKAVRAVNDPAVACVFGRREEMAPKSTVYNFWAHHDWHVPPGRMDTCGGDVLFRRAALLDAGGYDPSLIAGEERDLCFRLIRDQDVSIISLNEPMTLHDINMNSFGQYWRRCFRSGYAYAQVSVRYPGLRRWRRICHRNMLHGIAFLVAVVASLWFRTIWPAAIWTVLLILAVGRDAVRCKTQVGSVGGAVLYAAHHYLSKAPTLMGHLAYYRMQLCGGRPQELVEYRAQSARHRGGRDDTPHGDGGSP